MGHQQTPAVRKEGLERVVPILAETNLRGMKLASLMQFMAASGLGERLLSIIVECQKWTGFLVGFLWPLKKLFDLYII